VISLALPLNAEPMTPSDLNSFWNASILRPEMNVYNGLLEKIADVAVTPATPPTSSLADDGIDLCALAEETGGDLSVCAQPQDSTAGEGTASTFAPRARLTLAMLPLSPLEEAYVQKRDSLLSYYLNLEAATIAKRNLAEENLRSIRRNTAYLEKAMISLRLYFNEKSLAKRCSRYESFHAQLVARDNTLSGGGSIAYENAWADLAAILNQINTADAEKRLGVVCLFHDVSSALDTEALIDTLIQARLNKRLLSILEDQTLAMQPLLASLRALSQSVKDIDFNPNRAMGLFQDFLALKGTLEIVGNDQLQVNAELKAISNLGPLDLSPKPLTALESATREAKGLRSEILSQIKVINNLLTDLGQNSLSVCASMTDSDVFLRIPGCMADIRDAISGLKKSRGKSNAEDVFIDEVTKLGTRLIQTTPAIR
jgi:hypothetical protein